LFLFFCFTLALAWRKHKHMFWCCY